MSYAVRATGQRYFEIAFTDEPPFIHALKMAPPARESELNSGTWLVLAFAVWGIPDYPAIALTIALAKELNGKLALGVRPYHDIEEFSRWCPSLDFAIDEVLPVRVSGEPSRREIHITASAASHPKWFLIRNGEFIRVVSGPQSMESLRLLTEGIDLVK